LALALRFPAAIALALNRTDARGRRIERMTIAAKAAVRKKATGCATITRTTSDWGHRRALCDRMLTRVRRQLVESVYMRRHSGEFRLVPVAI
jgi:hypothetical protein